MLRHSHDVGQVDVGGQEQQDRGQTDTEGDVEQAGASRQPGAVGRWILTMASARIPVAAHRTAIRRCPSSAMAGTAARPMATRTTQMVR